MPCLLDRGDVLFTTSGRASILLALEALGIGTGDKVLLPTYHCPTMVAPVVELGAEPSFYPIDETGSPVLGWLEAMDPARRIRAIVAAHYFGLPQPMARLRAWCDRSGIALIEDCAHALFGMAGERPVGAWGDLAIASLTKFLPVPEGGCLVAAQPRAQPTPLWPRSPGAQLKAALDIVQIGADHRRLPGLNGLLRGAFGAVGMLRRTLGSTRRGSEAPAADAGAALHEDSGYRIDRAVSHQALTSACRWMAQRAPRQRIVDRRRDHYAALAQGLSERSPQFQPVFRELPDHCAPYVMPLWVAQPDPGYAELRRLGIPVSRWDRLWPGVPAIAGDTGLNWSHHVLQLACHQDLTAQDLHSIVDAIVHVYG